MYTLYNFLHIVESQCALQMNYSNVVIQVNRVWWVLNEVFDKQTIRRDTLFTWACDITVRFKESHFVRWIPDKTWKTYH